MSSDQWQRIEDVFHRAVELPPAERSAFLDEACAPEEGSLRREVETLLAHDSESDATFAGPPADDEPPWAAHRRFPEPVAPERYQGLSLIGAGAMGRVYKAVDSTLGRVVALKVFPPDFFADGIQMARFRREAQVLASLNHPNVAAIYGVEESADFRALVMEHVDGSTLAERLEQGALPLREALPIARQIAEALETAHEKGIIHRDLKPANVKITREGVVKVLDFGLAKVAKSNSLGPTPGESPTLTFNATIGGVILGTAAYMAPEQASGKPVDRRADIWSFGVLLWEMLAGKRLFAGNSIGDILASVLRDDPDWTALPGSTPPTIRRLLQRCLEKDRRRRLQSIGDARLELEDALSGGTKALEQPSIRERGAGWIVAAVLSVAVIALGSSVLFNRTQPSPVRPVVRFAVAPPAGQTLTADSFPALSPDAMWIVFNTAREQPLYVRRLDSLETRPLPGTEGGHLPFWSPDSLQVAFFASGGLRKVDLNGGPAVLVTAVRGGCGGAWNRDGLILYAPAPTSPLMRIPASGGAPTPVTKLDASKGETGHAWPSFLPDGRHFLFTAYSSMPDHGGIFVGSLDSPEVTHLLPDESNAQYVAPGYVLYSHDSVLTARAFDAHRLRFTAESFVVGPRLASVSRPAGEAFSATGLALVYHVSTVGARNKLTWTNRAGVPQSDLGPPGDYSWPSISPDGRSVAVAVRDATTRTRDIWIYNIEHATGTRLTFGATDDFAPIWSPDSRDVAFLSERDGQTMVFRKTAAGTGNGEVLATVPGAVMLSDWTPDAKQILLTVRPAGQASEIWLLPLARDRKPVRLWGGPSERLGVADGRLTSDGKFFAYMSEESGAGGYETYVQHFPPSGEKVRISKATGEFAQWRRDRRELFYIEERNYKVMAVSLASINGRLDLGDPKVLFQGPLSDFALSPPFAVTPDGQRFLLVTADDERSSRPFEVVLNWLAPIKQKQ